MPASPQMGWREWLLLLALSASWGCTFFFAEIALVDLPPITVAFLRLLLASLTLLAIALLSGESLAFGRRGWTMLFIMGAINSAIPFMLIFYGQTQISSALASILNATTPLFTVVFAHFFTRDERLNGFKLLGTLLGLSGVGVLFGFGAADFSGSVLGPLACLGGAACYALAAVYGRRLAVLRISPLAAAAGQLSASTVLLVPLAVLVDQPWSLPVPGWPAIGAVAGIALWSTALAYVLFFRILASAGATNVLLVTFLVPVYAISLGTGLLGERIGLQHLAGMGLIALGIVAIDGRLPRVLLRRTAANRA
jgi:drug/metabolite transporter (DMT)-like permease